MTVTSTPTPGESERNEDRIRLDDDRRERVAPGDRQLAENGQGMPVEGGVRGLQDSRVARDAGASDRRRNDHRESRRRPAQLRAGRVSTTAVRAISLPPGVASRNDEVLAEAAFGRRRGSDRNPVRLVANPRDRHLGFDVDIQRDDSRRDPQGPGRGILEPNPRAPAGRRTRVLSSEPAFPAPSTASTRTRTVEDGAWHRGVYPSTWNVDAREGAVTVPTRTPSTRNRTSAMRPRSEGRWQQGTCCSPREESADRSGRVRRPEPSCRRSSSTHSS